jgi:uncharacterized protein (TIGR02001 family)
MIAAEELSVGVWSLSAAVQRPVENQMWSRTKERPVSTFHICKHPRTLTLTILFTLLSAAATSASDPAVTGLSQETAGSARLGSAATRTAPDIVQSPGTPAQKEARQAAPEPVVTVTGNLAVTSNYVFRGLTQTDGKPALQGGIDLTFTSGFYLGTWMSNISWYTDQNAGTASNPVALSSPGSLGPPYVPFRSNSANLEWDFYGGYRRTFATDWSFDLGVIEYYYPGVYDNLGAYRRPNTTEIYALIGYRWLSLKYSRAISTYTFGTNESKGASYIDLSAAIPVGVSGVKVLAHAGRQSYPGNPNRDYWGASGGDNSYFTYSDYKVGLTLDKWGFTFGVAYTYADTRAVAPDGETTAYQNTFGRNIGHGQVAVTISRSF